MTRNSFLFLVSEALWSAISNVTDNEEASAVRL